ncbi:MAG: bifunctional phosphopantothenoylcysteine decarboxylase/phosphopantothenate--cysteine ligase CoaBC [Bacteroidetes bacterium]|nr:MAG: bifunctional phosphopantothenoylcysteine decarboxylase/phosphopantothenate--cysteine ligase CoaBC [Bacteroidota bacterium]
MLGEKKILLGVCGSIAAYKSVSLVRLLIRAGAEVQVIMTQAATGFITPLTLSTISKREVLIDFYEGEGQLWNNHVHLGLWADLMVIAPASANTMAKCSQGICDNLLTAVYLSARCPVYWAPAMDLDMYQHPSTKKNLLRFKEFGNHVIEAKYGELASGLVGTGRMAEPEEITAIIENHFSINNPLTGKKAMVTAGPTFEQIDPVRFIGNYSSGKMGYAIAKQLADLGTSVTLVSGPTTLVLENSNIELIKVKSAVEMYKAVSKVFPSCDIAIFAAAVADFTPVEKYRKKIKKTEDVREIQLTSTPDIAFEMGKLKEDHQFTVGFSLETDNEEENAIKKLTKKNLDFIVLNSLNDEGAGFAHDTNRITIIDKDNNRIKFELKSKADVANDIVQYILNYSKK